MHETQEEVSHLKLYTAGGILYGNQTRHVTGLNNLNNWPETTCGEGSMASRSMLPFSALTSRQLMATKITLQTLAPPEVKELTLAELLVTMRSPG